MGQPYVGEIRLFAGNFAISGWMTCDGQTLAISEYDTLFQLIGTTYGGDGQNTFCLPNLSGRVPIHMGSNGTSTYNLADSGGVTEVTLTTAQMPSHTHVPVADNSAATTDNPSNAYFANAAPNNLYTVPNSAANPNAPALQTYNSNILPSQGGSQPHDNMQPYLAVNYIISLFGIYPSAT
ncbi:MAG TPA: tail fiber protein [Candidatus Baltobacteraceae bacterium]|nr:tail fiber protein [Candidatus Baltobacteraceae bacterium]